MAAHTYEPDHSPSPQHLTLRDFPFSELIVRSVELAQLRRDYSTRPAKERRLAALFEYDRSCADQLFFDALGGVVEGFFKREDLELAPRAVVALAIDPQCAPAILTVGSVEYQLGRTDEAMQLFLSLAAFAADTKDLAEIIDRAGDFLIDEGDIEAARRLYTAAVEHHPNVAVYYRGLGFCAGKLGDREQALVHSRQAVRLEPENAYMLNDLGWALVEAEAFDEAEKVLFKAVAFAPPDFEFPCNNLEKLERRRKKAKHRRQRKSK